MKFTGKLLTIIIIYVFGPGPAGPGAVLIPHSKLTD